MVYIKKRYSFSARKRVSDEEYKELNFYQGAIAYEKVIYCGHCRKMNSMLSFFDIQATKEELSSLWKLSDKYLIPSCDFTNSKCYIVEYLAQVKNIKFETKSYEDITNEDIENMQNIKIGKTAAGIPTLTCPSCGRRIAYNNLFPLIHTKDWVQSNSFIHAYDIKEDGEKTIFSIYLYAVMPLVDIEKLKYTEINIRIIFNNKTKCIYIMQPIYTKNMKPVYTKIKRMVNMTYMTNYYMYLPPLTKKVLESDEFLDAATDYFSKKMGLDNPNKEIKSLYDLVVYFRYPKYSTEVRDIIKEICKTTVLKADFRQRRKRLLQDVYLMQDDYEKIQEEMRKKKLPQKKRLKKMVIENPFCIYIYRLLTKLGMKDYNVILNSIEELRPFFIAFIKIYANLSSFDGSTAEKIFLKDFIANKGDISIKKNVFDEMVEEYKFSNAKGAMRLLIDTAELYIEVRRAIGIEQDFEITFTNLLEMHDNLPHILAKLQHKNRKIPYIEEDLRLNADCGDYKFRLADNTLRLIDCGEKMGICVGGYGNRAVTKSCIIVFMLKDNKFVGCIELSPDKKWLYQAKTKFNNLMYGEQALALKQWVELNNIKIEKCYDYRHIAENNFMKGEQDRTFNYSITKKLEDPDSENKNIDIVEDYMIVEKSFMEMYFGLSGNFEINEENEAENDI